MINRTPLTTILLAVAALAVTGPARAGAQTPASHLSGRWQLNVQASDKPPALPTEDAKNQPKTEKKTTDRPAGKQSPEPFGGLYGDAADGISAGTSPEDTATRAGYGLLRNAAHELTIFEQPPNVIMTDEHGRVEIVRATGEKAAEVLPDGAQIRRTASWQNAALVVRTEIDNGPLVVQTYSPSPDGTRMTVVSTLEPRAKKTKGKEPASAPAVSVRWVYESAAAPGAGPTGEATGAPASFTRFFGR